MIHLSLLSLSSLSHLSLSSLSILTLLFISLSSEVLTTPEVSKYELNYVTSHKGPSLVAAFSRSGETAGQCLAKFLCWIASDKIMILCRIASDKILCWTASNEIMILCWTASDKMLIATNSLCQTISSKITRKSSLHSVFLLRLSLLLPPPPSLCPCSD